MGVKMEGEAWRDGGEAPAVREGIATTHNGIRYRSRVEARWAEFFRLLGWCAFYEPFDLDGYIPDFVLHGRNERILVEVKPVSGMDDPLFKKTAAKIEKSGWEDDALIVSYFLPHAHSDHAGIGRQLLCVGWLGKPDPPWPCWRTAPFNYTKAQLGFRVTRSPIAIASLVAAARRV